MSDELFVDGLKVDQLKAYLRQSGLSVSGNKRELQRRLPNHMESGVNVAKSRCTSVKEGVRKGKRKHDSNDEEEEEQWEGKKQKFDYTEREKSAATIYVGNLS